MYHHFILSHTDYNEGKRIALHKCSTTIDELDYFLQITNDLKEKFPYLSFGFHHIQTNEKKWKSVYEYDMFFKDVFPISDIDTFKNILLDETNISALDIANLIVSRTSCTHLKLQKLLYFFYVDYIKKFKKPPFNEQFLAWDYGPVVKEVYEVYKQYGREEISSAEISAFNILEEDTPLYEDDTIQIIKEEPFKLSVYSRFKKVPIYRQILNSLDNTLKNFGDSTASELVDLTHEKGSPWDKAYRDGLGKNSIIHIEEVL